jgi:hypothetical protein
LLVKIYDAEDVRILKGVVSRDHVDMHIEYPPKMASAELLKWVEGRWSQLIQQEFPPIFIVLVFIKISSEFCDVGKTTRVKLALETFAYMLVFKNSSAEQNRNFEFGYFFSEIFVIARQPFQIIYYGGGNAHKIWRMPHNLVS